MTTAPHLPPDTRLLSREEDGRTGGLLLTLESALPPPVACPRCGGEGIRGFGRRSQRVKDIPHAGRPVTLLVKSNRRWQCKSPSCRYLFASPLPWIRQEDRLGRLTVRLYEWVASQPADRSNVEIAREAGLSEAAVRGIRRETGAGPRKRGRPAAKT